MPADKPVTAAGAQILVHRGALGDFLLLWPAMLALARAARGAPRYWCGPSLHAPWAAAAGWEPIPPGLGRAVEALYHACSLPPELAGATVTWFGLRKNPLALTHPALRFVPTLPEGCHHSPRATARTALAALGIPWVEDWRAVWRERCGGWEPHATHRYGLLLFPGAGHRAKHWPLERFVAVALELAAQGERCALVLGPAERERGLDPLPLLPQGADPALCPELLYPASLAELGALLLSARRVLGNDCGPLHLASMFGVPGVVLFGPTARRLWAPEGLTALAGSVPCRPCSVTTADIGCERPLCLEALGVGEVLAALGETGAAW